MATGRKRVVVVGGGIAGVGAARTLVERVGDSVDVTIVTRDTYYAAGPSRPLILTGEQSVDRIMRGYEPLAHAGIKVVYGAVKRVDPGERRVYFTSPGGVERSLGYDYLILAPGVVYDGSGIEGYWEHMNLIVNVYELGRVQAFKHELWSIREGAVLVYAPKMPYRCAPAPSETTLLVDTVLRHRGVRGRVRVIHVDANEVPQPKPLAKVYKEMFEDRGIELITGREIVEVGNGYVRLSDGEKLEYTILAMLEPNRAPRFIEEAGLGERWVEVRSPTNLRHPKYDDVLAAGDAAKLPFPKNQEIAYESALYAANSIIEELGGEPVSVQYAFVGWVYVGNPEGRLETLSVQFGLDFTRQPPGARVEGEPKREYTLQKDRWEQSYLNRLYHTLPGL